MKQSKRLGPISLLLISKGPEDIIEASTTKEFQEFIYFNTFKILKDEIENNPGGDFTIFNIPNMGVRINLKPNQLSTVLEKTKHYFENKEEFEKCIAIQKLIETL